jgi:hypothetical protein
MLVPDAWALVPVVLEQAAIDSAHSNVVTITSKRLRVNMFPPLTLVQDFTTSLHSFSDRKKKK